MPLRRELDLHPPDLDINDVTHTDRRCSSWCRGSSVIANRLPSCRTERGRQASSTGAAHPALTASQEQIPGLTAIFAVSEEMSAAVVNELQRHDRRVPKDVSVLSFDSTFHIPARPSAAQHCRPTTCRHGK
ncbi:substrate-binding domain-containing protein [Arthrobacter sp. StoSoilA2]|uniref:substrate-binding domain-containing protein n=1 Tax=Arthrobacter sp. StoSoilA2 TaxID=2830990 RepID=UPI001CC5E7C6|nr:substrate-binding domain-containing protein [Arthrobacter sp. StoSoilA2]